jgi:hypothetical protein
VSFSRRRLFSFLGEAASGAASAAAGAAVPPEGESPHDTEALESALEILGTTGPEYGGGLANHGPMAAEALVVLGRPQAVVPWVERYRRGLSEPLRSRKPIADSSWREALGDWDRAGDWILYFRRAIADRSWKKVLVEWTARLAPGSSAAAFHGLIRTAHAVRSLARRDGPARRRELAEGLGYWAARYTSLPDASEWRTDTRLPSEALPAVELLPREDRNERAPSITAALEPLAKSAAFAAGAGLVDPGVDGSRLVSDMSATFADVYLAHATPRTAIALLHAVTGPSAVRLLLPHLDDRARRLLLRYTWQAAAGIYAVYGRMDAEPPPMPGVGGRETLVDRAVASGDEHAIKLAEACLRENAVAPSPVFLAAAQDGTTRFRRA